MEKLKLALDDLVVETFAPAAGSGRMGTVHARDWITDEFDSCGVQTECGADGCSNNCVSAGCPASNTCPGWDTCSPAYTCADDATCQWPACTQDPHNIC